MDNIIIWIWVWYLLFGWNSEDSGSWQKDPTESAKMLLSGSTIEIGGYFIPISLMPIIIAVMPIFWIIWYWYKKYKNLKRTT